MAFDQDELARGPVPRDRHRVERMPTIAERDMRAKPRLAIPGRDTVRREQRDEILIKLANGGDAPGRDELRSEEHTSELQSLMRISYAVFCLKKKKKKHVTSY